MDWQAVASSVEDKLARIPADYAEVRIEDTEVTAFRFRGPNLESVQENAAFGGAIRVLSGRGWGFASFNSLNELEDRLGRAHQLASLASRERSRPVTLAPVDPVRDTFRPDIAEDPREVSLGSKIDRFAEYNRRILGVGEEITSSHVVYGDGKTHRLFVNNEGTSIDQVTLDIGGAMTAVATRGGDTQMGSAHFGSSTDYGVTAGLEDDVDEAVRTAKDLLDAPSVAGGRYTVVAAPRMAGVFVHEAFGHLSEADDLMENERMREMMKLGRRFGPDHLNIFDTGDTPGSRGFLRYDDEGVPARRADLVREGILVGRLHSRQSAATMGEAPTGNARAMDYRFPPICRMRNTQIGAGEAEFEDLFSGIRRGLYVVSPYGGQTDDEMFTFMAGKAYLIEDGHPTHLVRDVSLTGNVFNTLAQIDMIGREIGREESPGGCGKGAQSPLPVGHWSPHIRIQNVTVGGGAQ
ncbi:MAG: TldD/PmbA family protein [Bacillota bacterium]